MRHLLFLLFTVFTFAQQTPKVDFKTAFGNISINPIEKKVAGSVRYVFEVKQAIDTIKIDAQKMVVTNVKINNKTVKFANTGKTINFFEGFKTGNNSVSFSYEATPKQTMYFNGDFSSNSISNQQVWTQGQGKYTSHWFPSFDDVNEKVIFNLNISFDKKYQVLSNGVLLNEFPNRNEMIWEYQMQKPMSSYLLAVAIGDFRHKVIASKSGIPLQLFIQAKDTAKFEATYRYSKQIFDYLEKEIGVRYPWKIYKQIPVEDFLYAGMENTSATIFAQDFVVDDIGFNDRNYVNVNAHELAHQWFGDLVTAKSGKHHWLQEGFATYYALLAERQIFGDDYFYHQLYRSSLQLRNAAKTDTIPVMNEKASSFSFYQKGAWALHLIRETIGPKLFQKAVGNYLKKYQYKNAETDDFLTEIRKVSDFDTARFKKVWLEDYHFQSDEANTLLKKNKFIQTLFETQKMRLKPFAENKERFKELLQSNVFYPVKTEILYQIKDLSFEDKKELLLLALQTNDVKVRQSVAEFTDEIPLEFKADYETLLDDASYDTKEIALIRLCNSFPDNELNYLEKAKNWMGNNDLGLRTTFLLLTQKAKDFDEKQKEKYFEELVDYTSPKYESSIRQSAISVALQSNQPIDIEVLKNIVKGTTHFKWQFSKFSREYIRQLLLQDDYRSSFQSLIPQLNEKEKAQLQRLLDEKK
ncbi:M1 family metallopeptidase [Flavobacterium sp.]|uniref:M1 family metallopeptidase n=1 Tax=Flavobacterium sp. TaxID=239 RepID=UPI0025EA48F2|nr:M1 family metallopeptidase [Flavobacterium sp.]